MSNGGDAIRKRYDAVVIGSGFGGAVAACRLAQAGLRVGVLERGRRYPLGTFPRSRPDQDSGWRWQHGQGLFDVRPLDEVTVVQAAAYGGGSQICANVQIRVPPNMFSDSWPAGYSRGALDPYYDLVAYMLDIVAIGPRQPLGLPVKTRRMYEAARRLGRAGQLFLPDLAVNFGDPERLVPNKFGVEQFGCRHCGECVIGCNFRAKNTLDLNYLAVAEQHGAEVGTRCEVTRIAPRDGGYELSYLDHAAAAEKVVRARTVVLAAGAVNSTELLLRCRDQYGTLPALSGRLGSGYSTNGDFVGFALDTDRAFEPSVGPTITSALVHDRGAGAHRRWFLVEEGGFPWQIAPLVRALGDADRFGPLLRVQHEVADRIRGAARERLGAATADAGRNTAVFLATGRDSAGGTIGLLPSTHELRLTWNGPANHALAETEQRLCADLARALGGRAVYSPLWQSFRIPAAAHNLGGCPMADDPARGVTDPAGQVHGYPGLYVLDGGCLPSATGVNPAHTIAAVAERNVEAVIRGVTGDPGWVAPERAFATPIRDPLAAVTIPLGATPRVATPGVGLTCTETMRGYLQRGHRPADDFRGGAEAGRRAGSGTLPGMETSFRLELRSPFLPEFLADQGHRMTAAGTVRVDGITGAGGARVGTGVLNLLVPGNDPAARRVLYTLPFFGADGQPYLLDGYKDVRAQGGLLDVWFDIWGATTTLYTYLRRGHALDGAVLATGVLRLPLLDFLQQLATVRVTGTRNPLRQAEALARSGQLFAGSLWAVFGAPRLPSLRVPAFTGRAIGR
jgi:cholesterol oxidase